MERLEPSEEPIGFPVRDWKPIKETVPRRVSWRRKFVYILLGIVTILAVCIYLLFIINKWFDAHTFRFRAPVQFHAPIRIDSRPLSHVPDGHNAIKEANAT